MMISNVCHQTIVYYCLHRDEVAFANKSEEHAKMSSKQAKQSEKRKSKRLKKHLEKKF